MECPPPLAGVHAARRHASASAWRGRYVPMRFHVAQLLKEPVGSTRQYDVDEPLESGADEVQTTGPVRGKARLMRTNQGILARGDFRLPVRLQCARCLGDVELPVSF